MHNNGTIIAESQKNSGCLYPLNMEDSPIPSELMPSPPADPTDPTTALAVTPSFDLLHKQLTHPGKEVLQLMVCNKLIQGLPDVMDDTRDFNCTTCIQAKMTHGPFQAGHEVATKWLGHLHSNVCGPMEVPSLGKNHYFCTLVDDKTWYL